MKRKLDLQAVTAVLADLGKEQDQDHEVGHDRLRQKLSELSDLVTGLQRDLDDIRLREDLELVRTRLDAPSLPLWTVNQFGTKVIFGNVYFEGAEGHLLNVYPTMRVLHEVHLQFSNHPRANEGARSEQSQTFCVSRPRDQWEQRCRELPIAAWADYIRQSDLLLDWAPDFPDLQVPAVSWDLRHRRVTEARAFRLGDLTVEFLKPTTSGCVVLFDLTDEDEERGATFAQVQLLVGNYVAHQRKLVARMIGTAVLVDLIMDYLPKMFY